MNELVIINDGKAVTSTLQVAEIFGKQHKHVLEEVRNIINNTNNKKDFIESNYINRGRKYIKYDLTKNGYNILKNKYDIRKNRIKEDILYIIKHKNIDNYYKIGITSNLENRIKIFNTASPTGIEIIYTFNFENVRDLESKIHTKLKNKKSNLEWFNITIEELNECLSYFNIHGR